jgi:hypothetical protein
MNWLTPVCRALRNSSFIVHSSSLKKRVMGQAKREVYEELKKRYRHVAAVEVEDNGEIYCGYFTRPDMDTLSAVNKLMKSDEIRAAGILFDKCWIEGDSLIRDDATLKLAAISQLESINGKVTASVKNW